MRFAPSTDQDRPCCGAAERIFSCRQERCRILHPHQQHGCRIQSQFVQAGAEYLSRFLCGHFLHDPDNRPAVRRPHRQAESKSIRRRRIGSRLGMNVVKAESAQSRVQMFVRRLHSQLKPS